MHVSLASTTFDPVISPLLIAAIAGLIAGLSIFAYGRGVRSKPVRGTLLLIMRLTAIAALSFILLGPSTMPPSVETPQRERLTVLLDTSGSMLTPDIGGESRMKYIAEHWLSETQIKELSANFDLRLMGFDEGSRVLGTGSISQPPERLATGNTSHYDRALADVLMEQSPEKDKPGGAVVVIGDGHDTDDAPLQSIAELAKSRHTAIHTVAVGTIRVGRDVALIALPRQEYLMPNEKGQILVRLYQIGLDDATMTVHIRHGKEQTDRRVSFGGRASSLLEFPIAAAEPGMLEYEVWVDPVEDESQISNNRQNVFVQVSERPLRVLVLEGEPYWDTKFLAQSLRGDPRIEVTSIAGVRDGKQEQIVTKKAEAALHVPLTVEQWAAYDVVVLGRGVENMMGAQAVANLEQYVSTGGGHLVFARGRAYDADTPAGQAIGKPLAALEPVVWGSGFASSTDELKVRPTVEGRSSPLFSGGVLGTAGPQATMALPGLSSVASVSKLKPATMVMARGGRGNAPDDDSQPPVIVSMNYGRGRVLAVLGEGLWRWSLLPPELKQYRGAFDAFWSNAVRWLAMGGDFQPGQQVALKLSRSSLRLGDPLVMDVLTKTAPPTGFNPKLRVIDPDGVVTELGADPLPAAPQHRQATVMPTKGGVWRVVLEAPPLTPAIQETRFNVYDLNIERLRTDARPQVLRDLAEQTGGIAFSADRPVDLAHELTRQQAARRVPPKPIYAWDKGAFLAMLLVWMGLEWVGRRQAGWL